MKSIYQRDRAFSLVEILVCLALIAVLAALILSAVTGLRKHAAKAEDIAKIRQMASAVLLYHGEHGMLPGRLNRATRVPSHVPDNHRDRWFSTFMADTGLLPDDDEFWSPAYDYGAGPVGHGYVLNNTIHSDPGNFFGRRSNTPSQVSAPRSLLHLRSNLAAESPEEEPLSAIWMICNLDGGNYDATSTAGSEYAIDGGLRTGWGGRHYAFFDGRVEFRKEGNYPSRD